MHPIKKKCAIKIVSQTKVDLYATPLKKLSCDLYYVLTSLYLYAHRNTPDEKFVITIIIIIIIMCVMRV